MSENLIVRRRESVACNFCDGRASRTMTEFTARTGYGCALYVKICDGCLREVYGALAAMGVRMPDPERG